MGISSDGGGDVALNVISISHPHALTHSRTHPPHPNLISWIHYVIFSYYKMILKIILAILIVFIIWKLIHHLLSNGSRMYGGSFATKSSDLSKSYVEDIDRDLFRMQLAHLNQYHKIAEHHNETFIIGDIHDSLASAFVPLIEAGIIEEGSIGFDAIHDKFTYRLTNSDNGNKVVCCGDVLGRGGNMYALQLLECLLDLSTAHHDKYVFVLGNHEIEFMCSGEASPAYDFWNKPGKQVQEKLKDYFMNHTAALAYIFDGKNKSFVCSHTYLGNGSITLNKSAVPQMSDEMREKLSDLLNGFIGKHDPTLKLKSEQICDIIKKCNITAAYTSNPDESTKRKFLVEIINYMASADKRYESLVEAAKTYKHPLPRRAPKTKTDGRSRFYQSPFGLSEYLKEDGRLDVNLAHAKLCDFMNKEQDPERQLVIFDFLYYYPRPSIDEKTGRVEVSKYNTVNQYYTNHPIVDWFIGHTQVQKAEPENRSFKHGENLTLHCMDTNTMNFCGNENVSNSIKSKLNGFKYGYDSLYIARINENDEIKFDEIILTYDDIEELLRRREDDVMVATREREEREERERQERMERRRKEMEEEEERKEEEERERKEREEEERKRKEMEENKNIAETGDQPRRPRPSF